MIEHTFVTNSLEETADLGRRIGRSLQAGACVALNGPLGAGKTHLVKGIAVGLDVPSDVMVNSPTFVIINEYPGRLNVYHIDAYRLSGSDELSATGFDEMLASGGVILIEWAERVADLLPTNRLDVRIEHTGDHARRFALRAAKDSWPAHVDQPSDSA